MNTAEHTAKCLTCGRVRRFRSAEAAAKAAPSGRICTMKLRLAAMAEAVRGFTAEPVAKIREALADGAAVLISRPGVYRVVSSARPRKDGTCEPPSVYLASVNGNCNCAWGTRRTSATARPCYHVGIARVDDATRKAA
jgi:hypothetical protein